MYILYIHMYIYIYIYHHIYTYDHPSHHKLHSSVLHLGLLGLFHCLLKQLGRLQGIALGHHHLRGGVQRAADAHQVLGLFEQRHAPVHLGVSAVKRGEKPEKTLGKGGKRWDKVVQVSMAQVTLPLNTCCTCWIS